MMTDTVCRLSSEVRRSSLACVPTATVARGCGWAAGRRARTSELRISEAVGLGETDVDRARGSIQVYCVQGVVALDAWAFERLDPCLQIGNACASDGHPCLLLATGRLHACPCQMWRDDETRSPSAASSTNALRVRGATPRVACTPPAAEVSLLRHG